MHLITNFLIELLPFYEAAVNEFKGYEIKRQAFDMFNRPLSTHYSLWTEKYDSSDFWKRFREIRMGMPENSGEPADAADADAAAYARIKILKKCSDICREVLPNPQISGVE